MEDLSLVTRTQRVICNELNHMGWDYVGEGDTGVMCRNDCLFVYHQSKLEVPSIKSFQYTEQGEVELVSRLTKVSARVPSLHVNARPILLNPTRCSWHVERFGWLLLKGNSSSTLADLYGVENRDNYPTVTKILMDLVTQVDAIADLDEVALKGIKKREIEKEDSVVVSHAVASTAPIQPGSYFKATNPKLFGIFKEDVVYKLKEINADNTISISEMNGTFTALRKTKDIVIGASEFLAIIKNKDLMAVSLEDGVETVKVTDWASFDVLGVPVGLPVEFEYFNLDNKHGLIVSAAFNANYNYTALLDNSLNEDTLVALYEFISEGFDATPFIGLKINAEQVRKLFGIRKQGYDVSKLIAANLDAKTLQVVFEEDMMMLDDVEKQARLAGYDSSQIVALKRAYFRGVKLTDATPALPALALALKQELVVDPDNYAAKCLLNNGLFSESSVYMPWSSIDSKAKAYMRKHLIAPAELSINGKSWNSFLDEVFSGARYLKFVEGMGFLAVCSQRTLGWDSNSLVAYDVMGAPTWRATLINDIFYVNREFEGEIYV